MDRHVLIVDCNHLLHTFYYGMGGGLSFRVQLPNGGYEEKDTTIHNGIIKAVHRWSKGGYCPTALCFDRTCLPRKIFFQSQFLGMKVGSGFEYKGNRETMPNEMFQASRDVQWAFTTAGISCYAQDGYEADDLVKACIDRALVKYPDAHIDVVTNDSDLVPLVSDRVSVFLRSSKGTYAREKEYEKTHYMEITPENYQREVEGLSAFKGFVMPYNTLLLHKLLRGDSSDQYGCKDISKLFAPKKWNSFIERLTAEGFNFVDIQYEYPIESIVNKATGETISGNMKDLIARPDRSEYTLKVKNPKSLDIILDILKRYGELSDEQLSKVQKLYWGMNLNTPFYNSKDTRFSRVKYVVGEGKVPDIDTYKDSALRTVASSAFGINIK